MPRKKRIATNCIKTKIDTKEKSTQCSAEELICTEECEGISIPMDSLSFQKFIIKSFAELRRMLELSNSFHSREIEEKRQSVVIVDEKTPKRNRRKKKNNESEQNNCSSPPADVNISVKIEETTPGETNETVAQDKNNDDDNGSEEPPADLEGEFLPSPLKNTRNNIKTRIETIKEFLVTLAAENAIFVPKPFNEEILRYPSDQTEYSRNEELEESMANAFKAKPPDGMAWKGGNSKDCFTYLLLDPRVTKDMRMRMLKNDEKKWKAFVSSIFYVGKGQNLRPYDHLQKAYKILTTAIYVESQIKKAGKNIQRILQIWSEGEGVIVLKAFQFINSAEAHTREAVIIETLGVSSLCNINHGTYYNGEVEALKEDEKSSFGKYLLLKAMEEYNDSDEIKIFPYML